MKKRFDEPRSETFSLRAGPLGSGTCGECACQVWFDGYAPMVPKVEQSHRLTTVGGTAVGSRRSTGDTLNMGTSAGTGEAVGLGLGHCQ